VPGGLLCLDESSAIKLFERVVELGRDRKWQRLFMVEMAQVAQNGYGRAHCESSKSV
jgi:hypothetical protein